MISFNEVKPQPRLPPWYVFLTKGLCFFKKNSHKDKTIPGITHYSCRKTKPCVNKCNTSLMELSLTIIFLQNICLKGRIPLFTNYVLFVLLFHSHARAYCIHAVMSLLQMMIIYIHFYFRDRKLKKLKKLKKTEKTEKNWKNWKNWKKQNFQRDRGGVHLSESYVFFSVFSVFFCFFSFFIFFSFRSLK